MWWMRHKADRAAWGGVGHAVEVISTEDGMVLGEEGDVRWRMSMGLAVSPVVVVQLAGGAIAKRRVESTKRSRARVPLTVERRLGRLSASRRSLHLRMCLACA